jgi:hypothetical protein
MKALAALLFAFSLVLIPRLAQAADFTVTNSGLTYIFNGDTAHPDPPLRLVRGRTYSFDLSFPGHPFSIKTAPTSGSGDRFNTGVSGVGNGSTSGTLTFAVPSTAPDNLFYACENHAQSAGMFGTITVVNSPVPANGLWTLAALFVALSALGLVWIRRKPTAA